MNLFLSLWGLVEVEITGADLPATMAAMVNADIPIYSASEHNELTLIATIRRQDFSKLGKICEKRGESLRILKRQGLYWTGKSMLSRPVLCIGLFILLVLLLYLPSRVFFVHVDGNLAIPTDKILEAAENCGIRFGASRREVRSEQMKNALLEALPELQWAGVNTSGCVALISVRERTVKEVEEKDTAVSSIVAVMDGIVTTCTATSGNLLCAPGQAVKAGEILISGYTDCGLTIQATKAEGEVFAQTIRKLDAIFPLSCREAVEEGETKHVFTLLIGKKRINLWKDSGISTPSCGRMYAEYYVTLPGGFLLPMGIGVDTYTVRMLRNTAMDEAQAKALLTAFSETYLRQQMVAGEIQTSRPIFAKEQDRYRLEGEYVCTEMIGKVQREQIGEHYGENQ